MAQFPYLIYGTVYQEDGSTVLASVRVVSRNERSNVTLSANTDANGQYQIDIANFTGGYNYWDVVTVFVIYTNLEDYEEHVVDSSLGGGSVDLTLVAVPASDKLRYFTVQDYLDFFHLTAGADDTPLTNEIVNMGVMVETEIDRECSTRFSDGAIEVEVNDCDATTNWNGSTDAVAIAVTTDDADYRTRTGALDLGKSGTTQAFFHYTNGSLTSRDWTDKYIVCWVYLSSLSALRTTDNGSAILIDYGSSSANYYEQTWLYSDLVTGWNLLFFKKDDDNVVETGTPTDTDMTYFKIRFDNTAASDTVTAGNFIIDNIFLVHQEHFEDVYLDAKDIYQKDYFLRNLPVNRLIRFLVNRADEDSAPSWDELTEIDNEVRLDKKTGRLRIVDLSTSTTLGRNIFPFSGAKQARATYIYGDTVVPKDIKKLTILKTARDLMQASVGRAIQRGQDSFKTDHYVVFDKQIDSILMRYRNIDIINT